MLGFGRGGGVELPASGLTLRFRVWGLTFKV